MQQPISNSKTIQQILITVPGLAELPPNPLGRRGPRPAQRPYPEHRSVFVLLGNDFNTCYDTTLICLCVCKEVLTGGGGGDECWTLYASLMFEM